MYVIFQNIIIGAIGSILATIILYFLSQCYSFNSKKHLEYYLETAFNYIYQIENHCSYRDDYDLIMHCTEELHKCIFEIHTNIYPFSMLFNPTRKKLIQTILFDIIRRCEIVLFSTVGYDDENEKLARLKILKKYFYTEDGSEENCSSIRLSLSIVRLLLQGKNIRKAFSEKNNLPYDIKDFENIIEINSFRVKNHSVNKYLIQRNGLTKKQYDKLIKKIKI